MVGSGPHQEESMGSRRQDDFLNLERKRDWEGSAYTTHTCKSHSRVRSHVSQGQNERTMQREIDDLKKKLCHAQRKRTLSSSDVSSNDEKDASYRQMSRTPPSESFSYVEEHYHRRRYESPPRKGLGKNTMSKALNQISKSPFMHKIESVKLPHWFHQPTFAMYNGQTKPVEHVSQVNQRMAVHSKDEALMCKVFPSNLGLMAMRWFDGLRTNFINSFKELTQAFGSRFINVVEYHDPWTHYYPCPYEKERP